MGIVYQGGSNELCIRGGNRGSNVLCIRGGNRGSNILLGVLYTTCGLYMCQIPTLACPGSSGA